MSKKRRSAKRSRSPKRGHLTQSERTNEFDDTVIYKTPEYVEYIFALEMGIFQADTILLSLTDGHILAALESLVIQIQIKGLPHFREQPTEPEGLVTWLIVGSWREEAFRQFGKLSKKEMIGCLKTAIESVETRSSGQVNGRNYLNYLKKFMKKAGLRMELEGANYLEDFLASRRLFKNHERMSLAELGKRWMRDPGYIEVNELFTARAETLIVKGQGQQVIQTCQKLTQQTEEDHLLLVFYWIMGRTQRYLGQTEQALAAFLEAEAIDEANPEILTELARAHCKLGHYEQAIELWQECLAIIPEESHFYQKLADTYRQMGDLTREEATWRQLLQIRQRHGLWAKLWRRQRSPAILFHLADCLSRQGKVEEAKKVRQTMENSWPHPNDPFDDWAYWVRSRLERELNIGSVLATLRKQQKLVGPDYMSMQVLQACIYDWQGQPEQSKPIWRSIKRQLSGGSRYEALNQTCEILGNLLPDSNRLFELVSQKDLAL